MVRFRILVLCLLQLFTALSWAQTIAPDVPEPGSVEAIAAATGDPRFFSPWVSLPSQVCECAFSSRFLRTHHGRARRIRRQRQGLLPTAARWPRIPSRARLHHRPQRRRPRHPHAGHRRRSRHSRSRSSEIRHRRARRSAPHRSRPPPSNSFRARGRFTISTPRCTPTKPVRPKRCSSSPIASPFPNSR